MRTGFLCLTTAAFCALTPFPAWSQDTPAPSPTRASQPQVESLSAQRAEVERGKIYGAGVAYSRWIDNLAQNHGNTWLQKPVFAYQARHSTGIRPVLILPPRQA